MTKVLSQIGLTELIQLSKNEFLPKSGAVEATTVTLATVATSGSYNDLSNKPTIPAAQVNSDWNASSGVAQILNKPTLGTMAGENTTDYYNKTTLDTSLGNKVDKVSIANKIYGTDASGNQTTYNKTDLGGVSDVKVGTTSVVTNTVANLGTMAGEATTSYYTKSELDGKLSGAMHFKGTKATVADLPSSGQTVGDMWNITETGANYAWDGTNWDKLSENIDLSGLQPLLVSGTNIKTINNTSILGSGNINITEPSIATTSVAGIVKPDGTTITITNDGTISAQSGASVTFRTWSD